VADNTDPRRPQAELFRDLRSSPTACPVATQPARLTV